MCGQTVKDKMRYFENRSGMSEVGYSRVSGVSKDVHCCQWYPKFLPFEGYSICNFWTAYLWADKSLVRVFFIAVYLSTVLKYRLKHETSLYRNYSRVKQTRLSLTFRHRASSI